MPDDHREDKPSETEAFALNLLGGLFHKARAVCADRIIVTPLYFYGRDNVIFVIPERFRAYRTVTVTETWWKLIIDRVKIDAGLDPNVRGTPQDGEVVYQVSGFGDDSRVFVSIKTKWQNEYESARFLIA